MCLDLPLVGRQHHFPAIEGTWLCVTRLLLTFECKLFVLIVHLSSGIKYYSLNSSRVSVRSTIHRYMKHL